ncbi:MAG: glycosyltransferase family 4 protein [Actinobacteria bacterium]|nr:MAG: glycosyltransferase family 4 protein [Actinomycetota bacterium]
MPAVPAQPLRLLGVGNARSINFLRWGWRLAERGHEVHVVSDRLSERPSELEGLVVHNVRELGISTRVRGVRRLTIPGAIAGLARRLDVDVVQAHYMLPYGYWTARAGVHPFVLSPWGTDVLIDARRPGRGRRRARFAVAAADWFVVNSRVNERATVGLGADPRKIDRIVWYAELDRFSPDRNDPGLRARLGWPDDALLVLSLRNFRPDTNLDLVLRAFADVARREPRARLLLAARAGPLRAAIDSLVDELDLRRVVAIAFVSREDLPNVVASADLVVSVTNSDSTPASLLEAMASGLPAVCAVAPSIDEWVAQDDGAELVPPRDADALAAALLKLLRDPELRRRYGERNERFVRSQLPDPGAELERLYRDLVAR